MLGMCPLARSSNTRDGQQLHNSEREKERKKEPTKERRVEKPRDGAERMWLVLRPWFDLGSTCIGLYNAFPLSSVALLIRSSRNHQQPHRHTSATHTHTLKSINDNKRKKAATGYKTMIGFSRHAGHGITSWRDGLDTDRRDFSVPFRNKWPNGRSNEWSEEKYLLDNRWHRINRINVHLPLSPEFVTFLRLGFVRLYRFVRAWNRKAQLRTEQHRLGRLTCFLSLSFFLQPCLSFTLFYFFSSPLYVSLCLSIYRSPFAWRPRAMNSPTIHDP